MIEIKKRRSNIKFERKKSLLSRFFYWICFLAFSGSVIYLLFFSPYLTIAQVNLTGTTELNRDSIIDIIKNNLAGKYFNVIPKNNLILVRKDSLKKALLDKFKKIEDVEIQKIFPQTIFITVKERKNMLIFCSSDSCYILDEKGQAYSDADFSSLELQENKLIILRDTSGAKTDSGDIVLNADSLKYLQDIPEKIKNYLDIDTENDYETPNRVSGDIRVETSEGWKIYFNESIDIQKEIDMLKVVLAEKIGEKRPDLEYVDLRSDNKVYYKFKDGTQEEVNKDENSNNQPTPVEEKKESKKKKKKAT